MKNNFKFDNDRVKRIKYKNTILRKLKKNCLQYSKVKIIYHFIWYLFIYNYIR